MNNNFKESIINICESADGDMLERLISMTVDWPQTNHGRPYDTCSYTHRVTKTRNLY